MSDTLWQLDGHDFHLDSRHASATPTFSKVIHFDNFDLTVRPQLHILRDLCKGFRFTRQKLHGTLHIPTVLHVRRARPPQRVVTGPRRFAYYYILL